MSVMVVSRKGSARRQQTMVLNNGASRSVSLTVRPAQVGNVQARARTNRRRGRGGGGAGSMQAPAAYGTPLVGGAPRFRPGGPPGSIVVSHSEIVSSELGTTDFSVFRLGLTPSAFAWTGGVAANWSRFRWRSISFEFVTSSPTSQGGTVAMGATYDRMDQLPNSIAEVRQLAHSCVMPVWSQPASVLHRVVYDCSRWARLYYSVVDGASIAPGEQQAYIPGYFILGKQTQVNGQQIGHVVVRYELELIDPIPARLQPDPTDPDSLRVTKVFPGPPAPRTPESMLAESVSQLTQLMSLALGPAPPPPAVAPTNSAGPATSAPVPVEEETDEEGEE